jgi:hypothetical protein
MINAKTIIYTVGLVTFTTIDIVACSLFAIFCFTGIHSPHDFRFLAIIVIIATSGLCYSLYNLAAQNRLDAR